MLDVVVGEVSGDSVQGIVVSVVEAFRGQYGFDRPGNRVEHLGFDDDKWHLCGQTR